MKESSNIELDFGEVLKKIVLRWRTVFVCVFVSILCFMSFGIIISIKEKQDVQDRVESMIEQENLEEAEEIEIPEVRWLDIVYIFIGICMGIIISCGYIILPYLAAPYLRTVQDMKSCFRVSILAIIQDRRGVHVKRKIDKVLVNKLYPPMEEFNKQNIQMACEELVMMASKKNLNKINIITSCKEEKIADLYKYIKHELKTRNVDSEFSEAVTKSHTCVHDLIQSEAVVIIEETGVSYHEEIVREIEYCDRYDVPILGCLVIEDISSKIKNSRAYTDIRRR